MLFRGKMSNMGGLRLSGALLGTKLFCTKMTYLKFSKSGHYFSENGSFSKKVFTFYTRSRPAAKGGLVAKPSLAAISPP